MISHQSQSNSEEVLFDYDIYYWLEVPFIGLMHFKAIMMDNIYMVETI